MLRLFALRLLVLVGGRMPSALLAALADLAGTIAWYGSARLRRTTRDHMRHALWPGGGESERATVDGVAANRAARGCVRSAARYYSDFARGARAPAAALDELTAVQGIEHFFAAYDRGCGVVLLSAHLGNPEFLSRAFGALGLDLLVLTERLEPPAVHRFVHRARAAPGVRFLPADRHGLREALRQLRGGGVLGVLGDRDVAESGLAVPFFGERALLPPGPVELAMRTGAALVPAFVLRDGPARYRAVVLPPLMLPSPRHGEQGERGERAAEVAAGMRQVARALETGIRLAPEQWFPLQPVWAGLAR